MTVTQRAIVAGIALVAADLTPAQIAAAHLAINPHAELWQDPRVAELLVEVDEWRRRAAEAELRLQRAGWPRSTPDWAFLDRARIAISHLERELLAAYMLHTLAA